MKPNILVVDNDPYTLKAVYDLLAPAYAVQAAATADEMATLLAAHPFDLVVLDLDLGKDGHGLDWVAKIKKTGAKILVLTSMDDQASVMGCVRAAVDGILLKDAGVAHLLPAVQGALAGYNMTSPSLIADLHDPKNQLPEFSDPEHDLLAIFLANPIAKNVVYAEQLHLAEGTIKNKFDRINKKMGVHGKPELQAELKRRGYRPRGRD